MVEAAEAGESTFSGNADPNEENDRGGSAGGRENDENGGGYGMGCDWLWLMLWPPLTLLWKLAVLF